jgi:hypothetical protein
MVAHSADARGGKTTIYCRRGLPYRTIIFVRYQVNGKPVDLTGYTLESAVRLSKRREVVAVPEMSVVDGRAGSMSFEMTDDQTSAMSCGTYDLDIFWKKPDGFVEPVFNEQAQLVLTEGFR